MRRQQVDAYSILGRSAYTAYHPVAYPMIQSSCSHIAYKQNYYITPNQQSGQSQLSIRTIIRTLYKNKSTRAELGLQVVRKQPRDKIDDVILIWMVLEWSPVHM
ncbi:hypothetical protein ASPWEDRAFT_37529 [Aspergillus wentii DTO 134E9]|uniref:Uncharacterized protein n=1 Tax=Aspergillus wentii DTO 134E9 TaxID=1073089 RepID=A0A1L9RXX1_ASPWE|nr:uncharacterized protein ASPWEDRAFT_37529 [Aspergillus wentii DTO 134E9]OJJ39697.1 hypothetical protein ASPWEDRAFT_37529 [Aspergillus wentii DTO 134E9]